MKLTPREIARRIAKETSGISVREGRTNGKPVLHLKRRRNDAKGITAASVTIPATAMEWDLHPWNPYNQPKPKKEEDQ